MYNKDLCVVLRTGHVHKCVASSKHESIAKGTVEILQINQLMAQSIKKYDYYRFHLNSSYQYIEHAFPYLR